MSSSLEKQKTKTQLIIWFAIKMHVSAYKQTKTS